MDENILVVPTAWNNNKCDFFNSHFSYACSPESLLYLEGILDVGVRWVQGGGGTTLEICW